jgi:hypothetical protein
VLEFDWGERLEGIFVTSFHINNEIDFATSTTTQLTDDFILIDTLELRTREGETYRERDRERQRDRETERQRERLRDGFEEGGNLFFR